MRNAFIGFASVSLFTASLVGCASAADGTASVESIDETAVTTAELSTLPNLAGSFVRASDATEGPLSIAFKYAPKSRTRGTYFVDTGIRCITYPCPSTEEGTFRLVKMPCSTGFAVELTGKLGDGRPSRQMLAIESSAEGLVLEGLATHEGTRLVAQPACVVTGCSRNVCADAERITTCQFTPEMACFDANSICARDASGACGWAPTSALTSCLQAAAQN
jgi:hypothetical protein